jgi:hypothetical protein
VIDRGGNPADVPGPPPELLVADTLTSWGALADSLDAWKPPSDGRTDELANLSRELGALRHVVSVLDERLFSLRHFAKHISDRVNDTLHFLYPANEIYVVGQKP